MTENNQEVKRLSSTNNNKNDIRVNNQFSLTINLGDSLNVLVLIGGIYFLNRYRKRRKKEAAERKKVGV